MLQVEPMSNHYGRCWFLGTHCQSQRKADVITLLHNENAVIARCSALRTATAQELHNYRDLRRKLSNAIAEYLGLSQPRYCTVAANNVPQRRMRCRRELGKQVWNAADLMLQLPHRDVRVGRRQWLVHQRLLKHAQYTLNVVQ